MDDGGRRDMKDRSRNGVRLGLYPFLLLCLRLPIVRVEAFVIVNLKQQTLQTRPRQNMKRINTELERRHKHTSVICRMASAGPENDDGIDDLYRIVAEQDPEWFQDFVTNVLGEESVDKELLALSRTSASASREKEVVQAIPKKEIPSEEEPVDEKIPPEIKEDEPVVAASSATITEEDVPIVNDVKSLDENDEHEEASLSVEESTDVEGEESLDDEVVAVSSTDTDEDLDETIPLPVVAEDEDEVVAVSSSDTDEDLDETTPLPVAKEEEEEEVVESNETFPQNNGSTLPDGDKAEASPEDEASSDRIILYKDAYSQSFVRVNLADVISLGYLEFEICSLEADTLDLIASDGIVKPRSGVPSRWKIKSGQPAQVRILSKVQADQVVSDETGKKEEGRRDKVIDMEESTSAETDTRGDELDPAVTARESLKKERVPVSKEGEPRREADRIRPLTSNAATESARGERPPSTASKSQARGERDESPRDRSRSSRRERSSKRSDRIEGQRRVYDGRPSPSSPKSKQKRDDPPSPNSPVWVDIDTFRDLLRSEAGLRLRILGDDWADTVKTESNWRLDLYKEWLWTLHNGVGKPIVESRSDRMRRKRGGGKREDEQRDPPARRPRK